MRATLRRVVVEEVMVESEVRRGGWEDWRKVGGEGREGGREGGRKGV